VYVRNAQRKWGHFDSAIPVYVLGFPLAGRLTTGSANGTYTLRIKSYDWTGGLGTTANQGETIALNDFNGVANAVTNLASPFYYWKDFNSSGTVNFTDLNPVIAHLNHDCDSPNNP
jgi:hypothetical protein